jgi:hypothetical protein
VASDDETGTVEPTERLSARRPYLALAATHRARTDEST